MTKLKSKKWKKISFYKEKKFGRIDSFEKKFHLMKKYQQSSRSRVSKRKKFIYQRGSFFIFFSNKSKTFEKNISFQLVSDDSTQKNEKVGFLFDRV
jgi:hypothetical protein